MNEPLDPFVGSGVAALHRIESLRTAAVLAHWIPDIGFRVVQPGRSALRIATWEAPVESTDIEFSPCEFRSLVVGVLTAHDAGLATLVDIGSTFEVQMMTAERAKIGPLGLTCLDLDDETGVVAFAQISDTCASEVAELIHRDAVSDCDGAVGVNFDRDADLGVTLVHACFQRDDSNGLQRAFDLVVDVASSLAVERLIAPCE